MKYQKALLTIALAGTLIFSGCGTTDNTVKEEVTSTLEGSTAEAAKTDDTNAEASAENTRTGMITEVTDTTLTIAVMPDNMGNPPEGGAPGDGSSASADTDSIPGDGNAPSGEANSDTVSSTEMPGNPPDDGNAPSGDNGAPGDGNAPSNENGAPGDGNAPSGDNGAPDTSSMTTETFTLTDSTVILDAEGSETDTSALTSGVMVTVEADDDGNALSITISDGKGGMQMGGGPGGGSASAPESYTSVTTYSEDTELSDETFTSTGTDENAILVENGANVTLENITLSRTSSDSTGGDNSSFYGIGAGLLATDGNVTVNGGTFETDAAGGAGLFAYGDGVITVSDATISTKQDTSGGIHAAGGGTLIANNLTVTTEGESSAAIRSDRGGGTMTVNGGSYTSNGTGSPAVYCTANITVSDADLTAAGSEAVCIEGLNSLTLENCNVTGNMPENEQNDCTWTVILYQSMSGDSEVGNSTFSMTGGSLTSENGGLFYTTNTESTFYLSGVDLISSASDDFLLKCTGNSNTRGWGSAGANGADCSFTADSQTMAGTILWDSISTLDVLLTNNSTWTGSYIQDETNAGDGGSGTASLSIDETSTWLVTADSTLTTLSCEGTITDENGSTVTIQGSDGKIYVQGDSDYTITVDSYSETLTN